MVENIHRTLARRHGTTYSLRTVITEAASEVDRPIVYAVAIIVAGFLPIYVLSGPSGRLFKPMADTTIFALIGSLVLALTVLPVLCALLLRGGVKERRNGVFEWIRDRYTSALDWSLRRPWLTVATSVGDFRRRNLLLASRLGAEFMPHISTKARSGFVRTMPATISLDESSRIVHEDPRDILHSFPEADRRCLRTRPTGRRQRSDRVLQCRVLRRPHAVSQLEGTVSHQGRA